MTEVGRRRFLVFAAGAGAAALGCGTTPASPSCATESRGAGLGYCLIAQRKLHIAGASSLAVGEAMIMAIDDTSAAIVARDAGGFYALSATCPHACCTVALCAGKACATPVLSPNDCAPPARATIDGSRAAFFCPCHGSEFAADGSVLTGPAIAPLPAVALTLEGGAAVVDLATEVDASMRIAG